MHWSALNALTIAGVLLRQIQRGASMQQEILTHCFSIVMLLNRISIWAHCPSEACGQASYSSLKVFFEI
eukprot:m.1366233 g.1366233  ORF g.1366233 m.1366233 type:complete len:69 (-) comp24951_c0_seq14:16-222(-)